MCQKACILDADSWPWTPILTFYKLLEIERHPLAHFEVYNEMVDNLGGSEAERELINQGNAKRLRRL